ncbi:MAG: TIGR03118 family protein [Acidobacteriaceae bacterium]
MFAYSPAVSRRLSAWSIVALAAGLMLHGQHILAQAAPSQPPVTQHYNLTNLTSNLNSLAPTMDPNLINPWGLSRSSGGPWWVSDNGTGLSTLYDGTGKAQALVVTIPPSDPSSRAGSPTGTVFNGDPTAFQIAPGKNAVFLFVTEDGTISGWNPGVNPKQAVIVINNRERSVFKGATIATVDTPQGPKPYLYAADFRRGRVAVYDSTFNPAHLGEDSFEDERMPEGYAPFNVQNIGGNIYVAYAKQDADRHDEVDGAGKGFVDVFSSRGKLLHRLEHGSWFDAPWGLALASGDFGSHSHDVLVGQFGSGEILAFDAVSGAFRGRLYGTNNTPFQIDGLWALAFGGDGAGNGPATTLFFTAGPDHETNGVFGKITAQENPQGNDR